MVDNLVIRKWDVEIIVAFLCKVKVFWQKSKIAQIASSEFLSKKSHKHLIINILQFNIFSIKNKKYMISGSFPSQKKRPQLQKKYYLCLIF
jgi:hypothetical protein